MSRQLGVFAVVDCSKEGNLKDIVIHLQHVYESILRKKKMQFFFSPESSVKRYENSPA